MMNITTKFLTVSLLTCSLTSFGQQTDLKILMDELDSRLNTNYKNSNAGSITAALIHGDEVIWTRSYGFVDKAKTIPASPQTLYFIGSISKSVTGLALAKLVEQGIVKLDDSIERFVPEIRNIKGLPKNISLTFRQLATHTGGLSRETELVDASEGPLKDWETKLLACLSMTSFNPEAYNKFFYSNIGYGIMGLAMSRAARKPFDKLVNELVFDPLMMDASLFELDKASEKNLAIAYADTRDQRLGRGYKFPNGGVISTLDDMVNFAKAQLHTRFNNVMSTDSWNSVQGFQVVSKEKADEKYGYGLGLSVWSDKNKKRWVYHNGTIAPGYSSSMYCDLNSKVAIVILRNDKGGEDLAGIADEFVYRFGAYFMEK
jgi:CubicO group peptidase (beta-lactamase class C family)